MNLDISLFKLPSNFLIKLVIIFSFYFLSARIGLLLDPVGGFATLVWPASGVALATVILFGFRIWPAIFLAAFLANFVNGASFLVASGIAAGNTLEPIVGAYLLFRYVKFQNSLERLKDVVGLIIFAAILSTLISSTVGVMSLMLGGFISFAEYSDAWLAWWIGDMLGDLVVAPLILVWSAKPEIRFKSINLSKILEIFIVALFATITALALFTNLFSINIKSYPITHLIFTLLIWVSLRYGQRASVTATFIISIISIWGTISGFGVFITRDLSESLLLLQSFMGVGAVTFLILSAVMAERRYLEGQKDQFISIASHELRTPLTTLKAYADLLVKLTKTSGNVQFKKYVLNMEEQIDRLTNLIFELLDVSRIASGKVKLNYEAFLMNDLVRNIIKDFKQSSYNNQIVLKSQGKSKVIADRYRVAQVIINLLNNAIKFSPKSKKIFIKITSTKDEVIVSVEDFGIGINEDQQKEIFKRFYQVTDEKRRTHAGLGLGLYISSEIIKQHGGRIWVESQKGVGSAFSFMIPIKLTIKTRY